MAGEKISFNEFVENTYKGIPERTSTVRDKERAIEAKKKILNHPDCPNSTKTEIRKEIAIIEGEITAMKDESRNQSMNSSIFSNRNDLC